MRNGELKLPSRDVMVYRLAYRYKYFGGTICPEDRGRMLLQNKQTTWCHMPENEALLRTPNCIEKLAADYQ
jgi:hypothetical protein